MIGVDLRPPVLCCLTSRVRVSKYKHFGSKPGYISPDYQLGSPLQGDDLLVTVFLYHRPYRGLRGACVHSPHSVRSGEKVCTIFGILPTHA